MSSLEQRWGRLTTTFTVDGGELKISVAGPGGLQNAVLPLHAVSLAYSTARMPSRPRRILLKAAVAVFWAAAAAAFFALPWWPGNAILGAVAVLAALFVARQRADYWRSGNELWTFRSRYDGSILFTLAADLPDRERFEHFLRYLEPAVQESAETTGRPTAAMEIERLFRLSQRGVIAPGEFEAKKRRIIDSLGSD